ncbi:hypothetical protein CNMCM6936_009263 [Aspergillus lentulus]|uniref:Uncharacterized protein n=1 Tax=Aspergillus lentulus TaxID=293939 RepID=A0AAN6BQ52_ASPLE|nr:hypothetical protein CNMCM6069_008906 [Aspergillus lentulus]KAF4164406.1 hypothetical protein CNMCM6936_009263 [Aspergillus lentulus]KAF4181562.1 hypothetical protein CNMCM8060_008729 [Aspergillus lentulus]KAF4188745.1 hypothetical protein CNMCM7927_000919 [Aspergillus lentulus]KAF4195124.1 hypothetical protein CNMCM8694_006677 [Aspergillus lentulus]
MASEPSEEAITNFVNFTSTSREHAIRFLKANDLNSNKAINAYFEDPTPPQLEVVFNMTRECPSCLAAFQIEQSDPVVGTSSGVPPSRPPSMSNLNEQAQATQYQGHKTGPAHSAAGVAEATSMTLAEQEERELQEAVAMSLNQNLGHQEMGITSSNQSNFGKATRDHYDEGAWAMTLFNSSAQEIIISPDPADRRRVADEPAFLRPSQDNLYLGGLLTILHSIPLAREALLLRNKVLPKYGHDPQWWNGQPINLPKIVTMQDAQDGDTAWDDILYETQRLVAFLDATNRAFGSVDALSSLKSMVSYDSESGISQFLERWQEAAVRADPGNQLATVFSSNALKRPLSVYDTPIQKEFFILDPFVEPDHGQTLYDVLDRTIWSDRPGEELDDVWLEHVAEVLMIKLDSSDSAKSVDVKIPAVFYPDRYLATCKDLARDFRARRLQVYEEINKLEALMNRFSVSKSVFHRGLGSREILEKAAVAASFTLPKSLANGVGDLALTPEAANAEAQRLAGELRDLSSEIEDKLKELENRKQKAVETLRNYSKFLTEPSESPTEPPQHRPVTPHNSEQTTDLQPSAGDQWQWWRISFSTDDAKARRAKTNRDGKAAASTADVVGYTARKVREIEVLHAAREESKNVLLVYANSNAMSVQANPLPAELQAFVDADNQAFEAEFDEAAAGDPMEGQISHADAASGEGEPPSHLEGQDHQLATSAPSASKKVNVFDYEIPSFNDEMESGREMQERGYPQEWTFVQQSIPSTEASHQNKISQNGATDGSHSHQESVKDTPPQGISHDATAQHSFATIEIPDIISASPEELVFIVVENYIPKDELPFLSYGSSNSGCSRVCGSWVEVLPRLANTSSQESVFFLSLKALAFAIASHKYPQKVSSLDATTAYSAAICGLRKQLAAESQPFNAELAASIMCLSLAEAGLLHKLFVGFRPLLVIDAFRFREPTFLAEKQWTSIPFAFSNSSLMQDFLSGVAIIPNYLHAVDQLMVNPDDGSAENVTEVCFAFVEWVNRLEQWEQMLEREEGGPCEKSSEGEQAAQVIDPGITGHTLWFPSVTIANVLTHLWAIHIVCLKEIDKLRTTFSSIVEPCIPAKFCSVEYQQNQVLTLSKRICHSMEYLLQDELKLFGPASTVFPLKVAYDSFRECGTSQEGYIKFIDSIVSRLDAKGLREIPAAIYGQ